MGVRVELTSILLTLLLAYVNAIPLVLPTGQKVQVAGPDPDIKNFARAGCDNFTGNVWQPLRPAYHITAPYGCMNDPHGMFQLKDTVHVFFQYNPRALAWGAPFWGHVVSKDLAHWTWLPPALLPDSEYDFNGVWSGAATVQTTSLCSLTQLPAQTPPRSATSGSARLWPYRLTTATRC